jgi:SynChlorMet cassette protein ScmD
MNLSDKPIANPLVVLREEFDDWAVLFNPENADAIGMNPVGVAVWKRMNGARTLDQIVAEIKKEFADPPETILTEVSEFVDKLMAGGFVGVEQ